MDNYLFNDKLLNIPNFIKNYDKTKYNSTLNNYIGKLNKTTVENITKQLILSQLNAFNYCGFLYMDINLNDILTNGYSKNEKLLKYTFIEIIYFNKKILVVNTNFQVYIYNFYNSIYISDDFNKFKPKLNCLLILNIINTLKLCATLFNNNDDKYFFLDIIRKCKYSNENHIYYEQQNLLDYCKRNKYYDFYKDNVIINTLHYIDKVWQQFFGYDIYKIYNI